MQFTKFASLSVIFFVALFGLVAANPVLERAQSTDAQVNAALATLQKNIAKPIASISSCHLLMLAPDGANSVLSEKVANSTHPTFVSAAPLVSQLIIDLTAASGKIHAIKPSKGGKRQANSDSAASLASIVTVRPTSYVVSKCMLMPRRRRLPRPPRSLATRRRTASSAASSLASTPRSTPSSPTSRTCSRAYSTSLLSCKSPRSA
jgi:hypothetical protein